MSTEKEFKVGTRVWYMPNTITDLRYGIVVDDSEDGFRTIEIRDKIGATILKVPITNLFERSIVKGNLSKGEEHLQKQLFEEEPKFFGFEISENGVLQSSLKVGDEVWYDPNKGNIARGFLLEPAIIGHVLQAESKASITILGSDEVKIVDISTLTTRRDLFKSIIVSTTDNKECAEPPKEEAEGWFCQAEDLIGDKFEEFNESVRKMSDFRKEVQYLEKSLQEAKEAYQKSYDEVKEYILDRHQTNSSVTRLGSYNHD